MLRLAANISALLVMLLMTGLIPHAQASDTESEPYMIYIDPVTGKYTTTKPGQTKATRPPTPNSETGRRQSAASTRTPLLPTIIGSAGVLLSCYLLAMIGTRSRRP